MITKITTYDARNKNVAFGNIWRPKLNPQTNAAVKREVVEQAESIISALFNFFKAHKKHSMQNDEVLNGLFKNINEQYGVKKINQDLSDGIVFDGGDKNFIFSVHGERGLRVREQNKINSEIEKSVFIHENKLAKTDTKNVVPNTIEYYQFRNNITESEDYLTKIFDDIDFRLLQIRKKLMPPEIQAKLAKSENTITYIPRVVIRNAAKAEETVLPEFKPKKPASVKQQKNTDEKPSQIKNKKIIREPKQRKSLPQLEIVGIKSAKRPNRKLKLIGRREITAEKTTPILKKPGVFQGNDKILTDEIINLFNEIHGTLKNIKNSVTRSKIKNGYAPLKMGMAGSKMLEFESVGVNRDNISVNLLNDHYAKHLVINVTSYNGKSRNIIVTPKSEVMKRPSTVIQREWHAGVEKNANTFYTQDELDKLNFSEYLKLLKNELSSYLEFINGRISSIKDKKIKYSTSQEGSVLMYDDLFKSVFERYSYYKKNIINIYDVKQRAEIRNMFNIHTQKGHPSMIFRNITPEHDDLHLSFPKINDETCVKILVLDKSGAIKKTLLAKDDKLVKYDANNIHSRKRNDRGFYYHTQEEIEQSGLGEYLKLIDEQLEKVNAKINKEKNS